MNAKQVYAILNKLSKEVAGMDKLQGANCTIKNTQETEEGTIVVFEWTANDGSTQETNILIPKGIQGEKGEQGISITGVSKTAATGIIDTYTITFSDGTTSTFNIKNGTSVSKLSELDNDTGFITNLVDNLLNYYTKSETYSKDEIDSVLSTLKAGIDVLKVEALPTENISPKTIYLLPTDKENVLTQWMYLSDNWESFGDTTLDLSNVYTIEQIDSKLLGYVTTTALTLALSEYATKNELHGVAFTGKYEDLEGLPTIPLLTNIAVLSKFEEVDGQLLYDGQGIEGGSGIGSTVKDSNINGFILVNGKEVEVYNDEDVMKKSVYVSEEDETSVKSSISAKKLEILENSTGVNTVVGRNDIGEIEVYPIPMGVKDESRIATYPFYNVAQNDELVIKSLYKLNNKAIISVIKKVEADIDTEINILNTDSLNKTDSVVSNVTGVYIKKEYIETPVVNSEGYYEIDLTSFKNGINSFEEVK